MAAGKVRLESQALANPENGGKNGIYNRRDVIEIRTMFGG